MKLTHAEVCGIDSIFFSGFQDSDKQIPLNALPGVLSSPGTMQSIVGQTLSINVTYPAAGATIGTKYTQVIGTYTGPTNIGIVVNGVLAFTSNGQFVVPSVALQPGSNTLNISATKMTGETASVSLTVIQSGTPSPLVLDVESVSAFAPFIENFSPKLVGNLNNNAAIKTVNIDYDGDGVDEYVGTSLNQTFTYKYTQAGVYKATFKIKDTNDLIYTNNKWIVIQDINVRRGMLCDIYGYMREKLTLAVPDTSAASNALQPAIRNFFNPFWTALGNNLPNAVNQLGVIGSGTFSEETGQFLLLRKNPNSSISAFPIQFTRSVDGIWRISAM